MKLFILLVGAFFFSMFSDQRADQNLINDGEAKELRTANLSGTVTLPTIASTGNRQFRGSAYRNRGTSTTSDGDNSQSSPFMNTIVSVHPVSYKIENLPESNAVQIIQKDARFSPQVTPVTIGSTVQFVNDDSFYHNVFSLTPGAKFNIGRRPTGDVYSKEVPPTRWKVSGLGPIDLFCDIHSQMNAIILSLDTPYFTRVNEDGTFALTNLPVGTYELRVYNRSFELFTQQVELKENEELEMNINLLN